MKYFSKLIFSGGAITQSDYLYLVEFAKQNDSKNILEFGPGVSTYAFLENNCDVYTFEHHPKWFNSNRREFESFDNVHVLKYEARNEILSLPQIEGKSFDLAFVDAPPGRRDMSRFNVCSAVTKYTDVFILHDCARAGERATLNVFERKGWKTEIVASDRGFGICYKKEVIIPKYNFLKTGQ
jgi:hypothetical protein